MVSKRKRQTVTELASDIGKYSVIGLLDMFKMPAKQLQQMRDKMKGKATIRMARKSLIKLALEKSKKPKVKEIENKIENQPALLFSEQNPFELAKVIRESKSSAPAKAGDIAPRDIMVKAGPTPLKPGPVIGELQRVKIPATVDGDKIVVKNDTVIVREGEEINKNVADILMKLKIEPIEIGLNLVCMWERGEIFGKDLLFIPTEKYVNDIKEAYRSSFNLAINSGYVTKETIPLLMSRAHRNALTLALECNVISKDTIGNLLSKAKSEMMVLSNKVDLSSGKTEKEVPKEEGKERGDSKEKKPEESEEEKTSDSKGEESKSEEKKGEKSPEGEK